MLDSKIEKNAIEAEHFLSAEPYMSALRPPRIAFCTTT